MCIYVLKITVIELEVRKTKIKKEKRETYWKLNTAILEEDYFQSTFKRFWNHLNLSQKMHPDIDTWWNDKAKPEIKNFCMGLSVERRVQRDNTRNFLFANLKLMFAIMDVRKNHISGHGSLGSEDQAEEWVKMV